MKKKIFLITFLLLILISTCSLASYSTVTMTVVEEPVCTIDLGNDSQFEKRLISKDLANKEVTLQLQVTNTSVASKPTGEIVLVLDNSDSMKNETVTGDIRKDLVFESAKTLVSNLLEDVAKTGIKRLRFITSHPWDFNDKMIDVISKYDNIMKYIHLPVQSGSTRILKLMNRRYTKEDYLNLVNKLRSKIKNLSLSTDIIVGFPNETEEDFQETLDLVDKVKYDSAFTFIYSKRVGTPAAKINDTVSDKEKSERFLRLVKKLEEYISKKAVTYVGTIQKVLVDGFSKKNKNILSGYTEDNKLVNFKGDPSKIGKIIKVKIIESHTYSLIGEEVDE